MQTDLRSEKNSSSIKTNLRVHSRVHQVMPSQTLSSSACWPEDKGMKGQNKGGETRPRANSTGRGAARAAPLLRPRSSLTTPRGRPRSRDLADGGVALRKEGKQARGGALERTGGGGRRQRCGSALTSIGGAAARRPRWRSGLASPRWSSAATHSRSWQRCGGAGRSRGAWPDAREGRADPDAEPRGRTTRRHAGPVAPPWRCGTRRGRRAAPPWGGQGRGRSFCCA